MLISALSTLVKKFKIKFYLENLTFNTLKQQKIVFYMKFINYFYF